MSRSFWSGTGICRRLEFPSHILFMCSMSFFFFSMYSFPSSFLYPPRNPPSLLSMIKHKRDNRDRLRWSLYKSDVTDRTIEDSPMTRSLCIDHPYSLPPKCKIKLTDLNVNLSVYIGHRWCDPYVSGYRGLNQQVLRPLAKFPYV